MSPERLSERFLNVLEDHKRLIFKISNSYGSTREDREDLFQEITLQLWKSFGKYDNTYKYSTWIYRIALNVAITFSRKRKKYNKELPLEKEVPIESMIDDEGEDNIKLLYNFIGSLKEMDKALIILYLEDKSYQEISDITGISLTNVATKLSRIKQKLKLKFKQKK